MRRIVMHWTAGGPTANGTDKRHYHFIVQGDGTVVAGNHPPEANNPIRNPQNGATYAAHTRGLNTASIGITVAGMRGAQERPFNPGPSPITPVQLEAMVLLAAKLCHQYNIPVQRDTVLTHAEVQPTLKIAQRNKWDITWVPGMKAVGDPVAVGDGLRDRIRAAMAPKAPAGPDPAERPESGFASLIARPFSFFGRGRP